MLKINKLVIAFIIGVLFSVMFFFLLKKYIFGKNDPVDNSYYIITNQLSHLNKMVVVEQDFSKLQKTKYSYKILGQSFSDKEIMAYVKTNVQVSYNLNEMKIEVDSVGKKLIIKELPTPDIRITPNVEIHSIDDSFINRVSDKDIKEITEKAKIEAQRQVNELQLKSEGKKQLMNNLNQIFVLAKALHYDIVDETGEITIREIHL